MFSINLFNFNKKPLPKRDYRDNPIYRQYYDKFEPKDTFEKSSDKPNYNHYFKKRLYSRDEINMAIEHAKENELLIGSLPVSWLKKIGKEDISNKTYEVGQILSNFAKTMYDNLECDTTDYPKASKALADRLSKSLNQPFKVKYYNKGHVGKIFLIKNDSGIYVLKIFHKNIKNDLKGGHGINIELTCALYLNQTMKKNQCTKFYFGKLGDEKTGDCFMLTKYIPRPKDGKKSDNKHFEFRRIGVFDNSSSNIIGNTIVDFGGIDYIYESYHQKQMAKKIYQAITKNDLETIKNIARETNFSQEFKDIIYDYMFYNLIDDDFMELIKK